MLMSAMMMASISERLFCTIMFSIVNKCLCLILELNVEMTSRTCGVYLGGDKNKYNKIKTWTC